ncbi:MAG: S8 family serine peptidase [Clostridia bacterium]|nr:S8 family serine peptidase [Clostridia bacterium]
MAVLILSLSPFSATAATLDSIRASVISSDLRESIAAGNASEYTVMVSLTNDELDNYAQTLAKSTTSIQESTRTDIDSTGSLEEIQAQISRQRAESRAFYQTQNQAIIEDAVDSKDVVYVSRYSPIVILELSATEINQLALKSEISAISSMGNGEYVNLNEQEETQTNFESFAPYSTSASTYATAAQYYLRMIKSASLQNYATGAGVSIGMIETGIPESSYLSSLDIVDYTPKTNTRYTSHANLVASIIKDIAPNATLYCASAIPSDVDEENIPNATLQTNFMIGIEWLLDQGVNIINMSSGVDKFVGVNDLVSHYPDSYNFYSAWYDHISYHHAVSLVSAVGNAGNRGVASSSLAYNSIAVGAVDSNGIIKNYSSYNDIFARNAPNKPDICAPGDNICVGRLADTGTSFAAPQVTGVIALMMQRENDLLFQPEAVKAILAANVHKQYTMCTTERYQGNPYEQYGAGIVNCAELYASLRSERFEYHYYPSNSAGATYSYPITLPQGSTNRIALTFSRTVLSYNSCDTSVLDQNYVYDLQKIEFEIWHDGECIASSNNSYNNTKIIHLYTEEYLECTIKIIFKEATTCPTYLAFAWNYYYL